MSTRSAGIFALIFALIAAAAAGPSASAEAPPPIVGGAPTSAHPAVASLLAYDEDQGGAPFCSGTLISATTVLTAAHCLEAAEQFEERGFGLVVAFGTDVYASGGITAAAWAESWRVHPDYEGIDVLPPVADVGLVTLDREIGTVAPAPLRADAPDHTWVDAIFTLVGWGITSDGARDAGVKRSVDVPFLTLDGDFLYTESPGANVCQGDSGGALFVPVEGQLALAGVHSFVYSDSPSVPPCTQGGAGAVRMDRVLPWIEQHVALEAGEGGVVWSEGAAREGTGGLTLADAPACSAVGGAAGLSWAAGLLALAGRRRRYSETATVKAAAALPHDIDAP